MSAFVLGHIETDIFHSCDVALKSVGSGFWRPPWSFLKVHQSIFDLIVYDVTTADAAEAETGLIQL